MMFSMCCACMLKRIGNEIKYESIDIEDRTQAARIYLAYGALIGTIVISE